MESSERMKFILKNESAAVYWWRVSRVVAHPVNQGVEHEDITE
jgi:hypothetical protein